MENLRVKQVLSGSLSSVNGVSSGNDNINPSLHVNLLLLKGKTRGAVVQYCTINSNGNVNLHLLVPMKLNDPNERNLRYKGKTVWLSVNSNPQSRLNERSGEVIHYNSNYGVLRHFLTSHIDLSETQRVPNPFNSLMVSDGRLRQQLVPSNLQVMDDEIRTILNTPAVRLMQQVKHNEAIAEDDAIELKRLNIASYEEYVKSQYELYEQGYLSLSTVITTPKQNSISFGLSIDETVDIKSNPFLNSNFILNGAGRNLPISGLPSISNFSGLVQVTQGAQMDALYSDNINMLGEHSLTMNEETNRSRLSLSHVGIIKEYGSGVEVLLSITDTNQNMSGGTIDNNSNGRSRVEVFKSNLEKGLDTFYVRGTIRPVVRLVNTNGGYTGVVFFEIIIEDYSVHNSTSLSNSVELDHYSNFVDFEEVESLDLGVDFMATLGSSTESNGTSVESLDSSSEDNQAMI